MAGETDREAMPATGVAVAMAPGVHRLLAPNPSPMTHWGTNTYLVGTDRLVVIDPGPDMPAHFEALRAAIAGRPVDHIVVTHAHVDHSALAGRLHDATGAPVAAFGTAHSGRSAIMTRLAEDGLTGGGEGMDTGFAPDLRLADGARLASDAGSLKVLHTPGHLGGHLCLALDDVVFTGDHVMGWAPSLVSPPDGDLTDFMASCARLRSDLPGGASALPGHGAPVVDLVGRLDALIAHRRHREAQILAALTVASGTPADLAGRIYTDVPPALLPAATRNVLAHLIDLVERNRARSLGRVHAGATFTVA